MVMNRYLKRSPCIHLKRRKRTRAQKLTLLCDKLFSLYIRARDKVCQYPGCQSTNLQCAHIFSRRSKTIRWYPDNALALCYRHHFHFAHSEPILFTELIKKRLGPERYDKLVLKKNLIVKVDVGLVLAWLQDEVEMR